MYHENKLAQIALAYFPDTLLHRLLQKLVCLFFTYIK